jgi:hypothetical protein
MFCRFGLVEDSRPVAAPVWLKVVWTRPSRGSTCLGRASRYVEFSLSSSRQDRIASTIGWHVAELLEDARVGGELPLGRLLAR